MKSVLDSTRLASQMSQALLQELQMLHYLRDAVCQCLLQRLCRPDVCTHTFHTALG